MKYLCLIYIEETKLDAMPKSEMDTLMDETKEVLGGFYVIEARDLNEAIQLASKSPSLRIGSVEVRPIDELIQP